MIQTLLLHALIVGIAVTQPAILDENEGEWVAPGYTLVEDVVIDPLDYGEPIESFGEIAGIGLQCFFIPTETGEKWRVVILFRDKLTVLQEDEDSRDIPLDFTAHRIVYSRNGRYAVVLEREGDWREARVDLDTGEIRSLDGIDGLDLHWYLPVFLNDDGSMMTTFNFHCYNSDLSLIGTNEQPIPWETATYHQAHSATGSLFVYMPGNSSEMTVLNRNGEVLWQLNDSSLIPELIPADPAVSSDGEYILVPTIEGLYCYAGPTGELLWSAFDEYVIDAVTSCFGQGWAVRLNGLWGHNSEEERHLGLRGVAFGSAMTSEENVNYTSYISDLWKHGRPVAVAETGASVSYASPLPMGRLGSGIGRFLFIDASGEILWVSHNFHRGQPLRTAEYNYNREYELRAYKTSIQSDGLRFAYCDSHLVRICRIEGEEQS